MQKSLISVLLFALALQACAAENKIRQCTCDEQQQMMTKMEQMFTECQQKAMQDPQTQADLKEMTGKDAKKEEAQKACFNQNTHMYHEMLKCTNQKMADKNSCDKEKKQVQMEKPQKTMTQMFVEKFEQMADQMNAVMEKAMAQTDDKQKNAFARVYTKQMTQRMNKCFIEQCKQMDTQKQFGCDMKFEEAEMKPVMMDECFNGQVYKQTVDEVCRCSQQKGAMKMAEQFCEKFGSENKGMEKNFFLQQQNQQQ
jgi:hypothetical protein